MGWCKNMSCFMWI